MSFLLKPILSMRRIRENIDPQNGGDQGLIM